MGWKDGVRAMMFSMFRSRGAGRTTPFVAGEQLERLHVRDLLQKVLGHGGDANMLIDVGVGLLAPLARFAPLVGAALLAPTRMEWAQNPRVKGA